MKKKMMKNKNIMMKYYDPYNRINNNDKTYHIRWCEINFMAIKFGLTNVYVQLLKAASKICYILRGRIKLVTFKGCRLAILWKFK